MKAFFSGWGAKVLLVCLLIYSCDGHDDVRKLRKEVRKLKGASVHLARGAEGYQVIRHDLGSASIRLKKIKPHTKGAAITLEIGNLTSVALSGATLKIGYQDPTNAAFGLSTDYDVQQTLDAGKATKVTLILEGVNPSTIDYIRVSAFQPKGMHLIRAN